MNIFDVYPLFPIKPARAEGALLWDEEGVEYLDLYGGHAVISIGHSHPHWVSAIQEQVAKLAFYSNSIVNPIQQAYAEKLGEMSCLIDHSLFLCNSGAEANENALKLASFHTGKDEFIAFKGGFHGRTAAAVAVTDNPNLRAPSNETDKVHILEKDLAEVEQKLANGRVAAIIIEAVTGVGGIQIASKAFLEGLSHLSKKYGSLLIMDEVQSGFGRTGAFFGYQSIASISPDLITMAKGMGNGFPIGGLLIHPDIEAKHGLLGTTFGGNHTACAAGLAVLEVLESENLISKAAKMGKWLEERFSRLSFIHEYRGKGLMVGIEMKFAVGGMRRQMLMEDKIFTGSSACLNTLRLLPPLCITEAQLERFEDAFLVKSEQLIDSQQ
ncbi:MAG: aspartate aminotransferase family protein [Cyclobacteriaceae bacterium]|nr:aspartate aminotransferase family protein [Cyclobacteriaceae bacterium]MCH8515726.1 aspartate aminotransferase family protein [Cyclobacteriaceae bacterium]